MVREYSIHSNKTPENFRADASRNRDALITAARRIFRDRGPDVSLSEIAREANVSRTTFYRNFPDRRALVLAILEFNLDMLEYYSRRVMGSGDEFRKMILLVGKLQADYQSLIPYVGKNDFSFQARLIQVFSAPVEEAKRNHTLRADFSLEQDLPCLVMMLGNTLYATKKERDAHVERAVKMVIEGLGPGAGSGAEAS